MKSSCYNYGKHTWALKQAAVRCGHVSSASFPPFPSKRKKVKKEVYSCLWKSIAQLRSVTWDHTVLGADFLAMMRI